MDKFMNYYTAEEQVELNDLFQLIPPAVVRNKFRGFNIIPGYSVDAMKYIYEKWKIRRNDVFVVSYPKTGTNWVAEIVRRIIYQDEEMDLLSTHMPLQFTLLGFGGTKKFELMKKLPFERRCIAAHLPADLMNMEKIKEVKAKVVYVLRNPKDQMVSWYNYAHKLASGRAEPWKTMLGSGWEKYFEHVVAGDFEMNSKPGEWYPEHILSWYKHRDNKAVYFVYYEDLKRNPFEQIQLLAKFLEISLSEEKLREITDETSFDKMKDGASASTNKGIKVFRNFNMRKGEVGGWKDYFTVRQSERIDAMMEEKLKDTDIKFTYNVQ